MADNTNTRTIEVFRPGTFVPMAGGELSFSAEDLAALAVAYDAAAAPAPVVVGHPRDNDPAFGWATAFRWDAAAGRLLADIGDLAAEFVAAVSEGRYRKVSLSLFRPDAPANPKPGTWYPRHIGFLGGAAPAVPGLKPVSFAAEDEGSVTVEFGEPGMRDVAALFRGLREWLIAEHDLETADRVLPGYQIGWIDDAADRPISGVPEIGSSFAEPGNTQVPAPEPAFSDPPDRARDAGRSTGGPAVAGPHFLPEPIMPTPTDPAAAAAAAADFAARETALVARERALAHREHESFAEGLIAEGRLIPVLKDRVVGLLDGLEPETEIAFSEGGAEVKAPPRQALRDLLAAMPKSVTYGPVVPREGGGVPTGADFAAPDGRDTDRDRLDTHGRALAYQRQHPGSSYLDAVKAVDPNA